jgi:sugar phosphate permease
MRLKRPGVPGIVLFMLCLMYFITYIDRVNIGTAASAIKDEFHLSNTQLGLVFSAFAYPYLLLQIAGGWLGDRFGSRKMLFASGLIWALATILTGMAGGLLSLFIFRVLLGFGEGATFPCATRSMQSWVAADRRGYAQGITHAFARLGNAIAPPLVAFLMALFTWRGSFVVLGCISLIWVFVWYWLYRDNPAEHPGVTQSELDGLPVQDAKKVSAPVPWKRLTLRMLPVTVVYFCYGWTLWLYLNWLPSYFLHSYNLNLKSSALFASGVFFAGVVGDTLGGVASDRILRKTGNVRFARLSVIVVGFVGSMLSLVPIMLTHDLMVIALCLSSAFFFAELVIGPMWSIPMDIARKYSGTAAGLMNTGSALAAILSPLAFGYIIDRTGNWELPFIGSIVLLGVGAALTFTMRPDKPFTDEAGEDSPAAVPLASVQGVGPG